MVGGLVMAMCCMSVGAAEGPAFRPPATPLITHDPYLSCWSTSDRLYDEWPKHWTGKVHALSGILRVDDKPLRFMGIAKEAPETIEQQTLEVRATQTLYRFTGGGVELRVTFTSPLLMDDLDVLSRPASYVTFAVRSADGQSHRVELYFDATAEWAVNTPDQPVQWSRLNVEALDVMRVGTVDQKVLERVGDDVRIDWGYLLVAVGRDQAAVTAIGSADDLRQAFCAHGGLPNQDDAAPLGAGAMPRPANDRWPVLAAAMNLGAVGGEPVERHLIVAYDDVYALEYFKQPLRAWWRRGPDASAETLLRAASSDYASLLKRCDVFDQKLAEEATRAGGPMYAQLCALAYRQCLAANKLVAGPNGEPLLFPKENFSNGCIGTVDVIYPQSPLFLWGSLPLARAMLTPVLDYASSPRWTFPFAPHDLGTYPHANGQVYGGGEKTEKDQMPVEESGNMLLMLAALAQCEGNADYAAKYWPVLTRWAEYLKEKGLDPENQLCTDDFAGHLAHNVNLSAKAITALAAFGSLCEMTGRKSEAEGYRQTAQDFARKWVQMADDGDHYRLAFDKPGTWSQKYNLVWDRLLKLGLFPPEVTQKEIAFYKKAQNPLGLPLDNRKTYTKLDWILWTATLADNSEDFQALAAPAYKFAQETPTRVPLSDWYDTITGKRVGFQARSVVGGLFIKLLAAK